jgi:hypothetical protein
VVSSILAWSKTCPDDYHGRVFVFNRRLQNKYEEQVMPNPAAPRRTTLTLALDTWAVLLALLLALAVRFNVFGKVPW